MSNAGTSGAPKTGAPLAETEQDQISQNIEAVLDFYAREDLKISHSQRTLEYLSGLIGQPRFLGVILCFVCLWTLANTLAPRFGYAEFDPVPYFWLQGLVSLAALLTTNVVLITQNRLSKLEKQRAHLDLKVTLLIEQKVAKLIDLMEELRRDLPNVKNRLDSQAMELQQSMNPEGVLAALDEGKPPADRAAPDESADATESK